MNLIGQRHTSAFASVMQDLRKTTVHMRNRSRLEPTSNASYQNLTVAASSDSSKTERQAPLLEKCLPCALLHARDYSHDKRKGGHRGNSNLSSTLWFHLTIIKTWLDGGLRWRYTDGCGYSQLEHSSQAGQRGRAKRNRAATHEVRRYTKSRALKV